MLQRCKIDHSGIHNKVKLLVNIKDVTPLENDIEVGSLVRLNSDHGSTGLVVEFSSKNEIFVLWSTPPKHFVKKFGDIW